MIKNQLGDFIKLLRAFQNISKPFNPAEFNKYKVLLVLPKFWFTVLAGLEVAVPVPGRPVQHMSAELRLVMMQLSNSWSVYVPHYVQNLDILSIK